MSAPTTDEGVHFTSHNMLATAGMTDAQKAERADLRRRLIRCVEALRMAGRGCECVDHGPLRAFHKIGEPCPVEKAIREVLDECEAAL